MNIDYRRATAMDAEGVYEVAQSISKSAMVEQGATEETLSQQGFLLYPLSADDTSKPNYKERIELSSHFWVAADKDSGRILAFMMAYTFQQYKQMTQLTKNDIGVLDFFTGPGEDKAVYSEDTIYIAQIGTHADLKRQGIMRGLAREAFKHTGNSPVALGEVAQQPLRNIASSEFFLNMGFTMPWKRPKDDGARVSGTFMRTFPTMSHE